MTSSLSAEGVAVLLPDGTPLLESIDLSLPRGVTGLVGPNGSGKSTLLELLAGLRSPARGRVLRRGRVAFLPQGAAPRGGESAGALAGAHGAERWRLDRALEQVGLAGLDLGRDAATLSGGEATKLRLTGLLLEEPETVLLDEPTNHLDEEARRAVRSFVTSFRGAVLVATHDRELLGHASRIASLERGRLRVFGGGFAEWLEARRAESEAALQAVRAAEQQLDGARRAGREAAERQARRSASGRRAALRTGVPKMARGAMKRAAQVSAGKLKGVHEERVAAAAAAVAQARAAAPEEARVFVDIDASAVPARKRLVDAGGLNVLLPSGPLWPSPLSFSIVGPERIRLRGPNGSGKSTLLGLLAGRPPDAGALVVGAARVARLDQDAAILGREGTLAEALRRLAPACAEHERRLLLGRFGFEQETGEKPVASLSGGERIRAGLAALLAADRAPELLLLDEPSNHLDLPGLEAVAAALRAFRGALVLVTHDAAFARDVEVTRELRLPPGT